MVNRKYLAKLGVGLSVCSIVAPELFKGINVIPKLTTKDVELFGYLHPSREIIEQIVQDYKASWYGKIYIIPYADDIEYHEWWGRWATASLCEHLIRQGKEVKIG
jgi:hypothetical protein